MEKANIFVEIMNLIEKNTDIPLLERDLENWLLKENSNNNIYEIYKLASNSRNL